MPGAGCGAPMGGAVRPQQPRTYQGMRVAPPGGLIGQRPPGTAGEVHTTANGSTFTVSNPGGSTTRGEAPTTPRGWSKRMEHEWDPDDPWAVAEGVPPVIYPFPEPNHDPGPGVIGLDR